MEESRFYREINKWENDKSYVRSMTSIPELNDFRLAIGLVEPKTKVLSCGCGSGREVKFLVKTLKCNVTAIDRSQKILDISKKIEPKAKYILGDMLDFKGKDFDYVLCLNRTINHLPNIEKRRQFVKNSFFILKRGGRLIISTSHRYSSLRKFIVWLLSGINYYFSPKEINKWFEGLDFDVYKINVEDTVIILAKKDKWPPKAL